MINFITLNGSPNLKDGLLIGQLAVFTKPLPLKRLKRASNNITVEIIFAIAKPKKMKGKEAIKLVQGEVD